MATATGISLEEFERLPASLSRNRELVNGQLVEVSGYTIYHNFLRDLLVELLAALVKERRLGKNRIRAGI